MHVIARYAVLTCDKRLDGSPNPRFEHPELVTMALTMKHSVQVRSVLRVRVLEMSVPMLSKLSRRPGGSQRGDRHSFNDVEIETDTKRTGGRQQSRRIAKRSDFVSRCLRSKLIDFLAKSATKWCVHSVGTLLLPSSNPISSETSDQ